MKLLHLPTILIAGPTTTRTIGRFATTAESQ